MAFPGPSLNTVLAFHSNRSVPDTRSSSSDETSFTREPFTVFYILPINGRHGQRQERRLTGVSAPKWLLFKTISPHGIDVCRNRGGNLYSHHRCVHLISQLIPKRLQPLTHVNLQVRCEVIGGWGDERNTCLRIRAVLSTSLLEL